MPPPRQNATIRSRVASLDGLRGLAALVVVIHHALLTQPSLSSAYLGGEPAPRSGSWPWLLTWTPLHLFWAGGEAVLVFFVLSGLVLALPHRAGERGGWGGYYRKRTIRLYVPVAAAVLMALALVYVPSRSVPTDGSRWLLDHPTDVSPTDVLFGVLLAFGPPGVVNTALWSLHWEVLFSALLPAFLAAARTLRSRPLALQAACGLAVAFGPRLHDSLAYLPVFLMGTALAFDGRADEGPDPRVTGLRMAGPLAVALALLLGRWLVAPWIPDTRVANVAARMLSAAGATLLVDLVRRAPAMAGTLGRTPVQWLGSRSFSVYLVHEPIVVASAFAWRTVPNPAWFVPWIVLVSLAVGEIFYRIVERPALTLAARVGH